MRSGVGMNLGIIIAFKEEFREFMALLPVQPTAERDPQTGQYGYVFKHPVSGRRCVVTLIGEIDPEPAALHIERLRSHWAPRFVVMLGLAAGIHPDVRVGDVVIASQVDNYLATAKAQGGSAPDTFEFSLGGTVFHADFNLLTQVRNFEFLAPQVFSRWQQDCAQVLAELVPEEPVRTALLQKGLVRSAPHLLDAHLASDSVVAVVQQFTQSLQSKRDRNLKAIDMESVGFMEAAVKRLELARMLVIRGISGYGDERKSGLDAAGEGALRRYAMRNATRLLWAFLEAGVIPSREIEREIDEVGYTLRDHEQSVAATYESSWRQLDPAKPADALALRLLAITAFLAPGTPIDPELLQRLAGASGLSAGLEQIGQALARLAMDLSLLDAAGRDVIIHPLISDYTRWRMQELKGEQEGLQRALLKGMSGLFPPSPDEFWKITRQGAHPEWEHLPGAREAHVTAVWKHTRALESREWTVLSRSLGDLYLHRGNLKRARDFYEQALGSAQHLLEKEPRSAGRQRDVAANLDRLGYVLSGQGNLEGARRAYEQALEIVQRLAEEEPENVSRQRDVSVCLNKLGNVLRAQGNLEEAYRAYTQDLEIAQRLAEREPENLDCQRDVSVGLSKLGNVLSDQGNLEGAHRAYEQALEIAQRLAEKEPEHVTWQVDFAFSQFRVATSLVLGSNPDRPRAVSLLTQARSRFRRLAADSRLTHAQQHQVLPAIEKLLRELEE